MTTSQQVNCYDYPEYWDLAFSDETIEEADFVESVIAKYCTGAVSRIYEPGCGGGRLVLELARRGFDVTGCDLSRTAINYARRQLRDAGLSATLVEAEMSSFITPEPMDMAVNPMNTFRHLTSEDAAREHLQSVARSLRPGGLYVIGLHMVPPDADPEDSEDWFVEQDGVGVDVYLEVTAFDRSTRLETLEFTLDVTAQGKQLRLVSSYEMRLYLASQMQSLLDSVPEFELLDVYDFCYEIDMPLQLNDELGDTVLILRRVGP